jgi:hypothetical protein
MRVNNLSSSLVRAGTCQENAAASGEDAAASFFVNQSAFSTAAILNPEESM